MISLERAKEVEGKQVKVLMTDGEIFSGYCESYQQPEEENEKYHILIEKYGGLTELNFDEIESIIILED